MAFLHIVWSAEKNFEILAKLGRNIIYDGEKILFLNCSKLPNVYINLLNLRISIKEYKKSYQEWKICQFQIENLFKK